MKAPSYLTDDGVKLDVPEVIYKYILHLTKETSVPRENHGRSAR